MCKGNMGTFEAKDKKKLPIKCFFLAVTANHRFSAVEYVRAVLALVECLYK